MSRPTATPGSRATLEFGDIRYNPLSLTSAIEQMKDECRRVGIGQSSVVVLHTDLTDRYVIALLALTEMESCVVPVDPATAPAVVIGIVEMTAATAIVDNGGITVCNHTFQGFEDTTLLRENLDDAAFVLFTSGTTGEPKGVVGTRQGLANRVEWGCQYFFSPEVNRCAIKTNPAFVDSLTEILASYHTGCAMVVAPLDAQRDLGQLCDFIDSARIEQITLTPSCIPLLDAVGGERLRRVQRWIFSGEVLRHSWLNRIRVLAPQSEVINSYGSTEVCGDATFFVLGVGDPIPTRVPIGRPVPGVRLRIDHTAVSEDQSYDPLREGAGELWIGGDQVAHGYLESAGSTEECRFSRASDGSQWFRTGDVVDESDGLLFFIGRVGDVHKVRGRRVDVTGVAVAIESLEGVRAAHAWVSNAEASSSMLRVAVIPEPRVMLTSASVLTEAGERLLPQIVPDRVDVVRRFQRTASGKVDPHRTISQHYNDRPLRSRFATGLQHVIACILSEAVRDSDVWPTTVFSEVGLNSLDAVQVAEDISRYLGCHVTALDVLAARTVEELAEQVPVLQAFARRPARRLVCDGDSRRTLLLLHPAIGTCLGYFALLHHMTYPGRVVFVEQDESARAILDRYGLEALATFYAAQCENLDVGTAVEIVGYSFGALIAASVAGALRSRGNNVTSVVLIDPASIQPGAPVTLDWALRRVLTDAGYRDHLPDAPMDLSAAMKMVRKTRGPLARVPAEQLGHWTACLQSNMLSCAGFEPQPSPVPTLVVRAAKTSSLLSGTTELSTLMPLDTSVVDIDCTHFDLLHGDSVVQLAASISGFLMERSKR